MARYFFDLYECGTLTTDDEGQDMPSLEAVRVEALRLARAIMAGEIEAGRLCLLCRIAVRDAKGNVVLEMPFRDAVVITRL